MKFETRHLFEKYTDKETFDNIKEYATLVEMLESSVRRYGDDPAITDATGAYSYRDLDRDVAAFRGALKARGILPGARVGIIGANSYQLVKAFLGVTTYGCTAVVLPMQLDDKTVFGCSMKFAMNALVYHDAFEEKIAFARSTNKNLVCLSWSEAGDAVPAAEVTGETPCVIMFTGGTTGKSKGALLTHRAILQGTVNGCYGYKDVFGQRYMLALPLSHIFGLVRNMLTPLYTGSHVFICKTPKDLFSDIAVFKPTVLVLVPALAEMALNLSRKFNRNMLGADMKYIICGAAAVAPYLIEEYAKIGITVFPGYGLTESANLVSGNPEQGAKPESVGIPYPHQEFKIVDGELWLKGLNMMEGYVGEAEENANAYEDGWFKTGDLVRLDEDGFLYIVGRSKDIIVLSNGENVSPAEVETYFNALPTVQDSQVYEDVLENGVHILAVEVVPRITELARMGVTNVAEYLENQLKEVNTTLPSHMKITKFIVRDSDFERTPSMKIVRYKKCN
ncbi:MAG: acyl--CoA ligase [Clostridia bacterium]|nr:acyl--CoA ligase [Clostridia bacterium]